MPTPPYPLRPEPMKRGWLERNPRWKIPLGGLIFFCLLGGFATITMAGVSASLRSSEVYRQALARCAADPQASQRLGEPIRPGWLILGELHVNGSEGAADFSIPVSGSRSKASIHAVAVKSAGVWRFTTLQVNVEGAGAPIDLLSVEPPPERQF